MNSIQIILGIFFGISGLLLFLSPVIISLFTGNWWFMLLFAVSWIAGLGCVVIANAFLEDK